MNDSISFAGSTPTNRLIRLPGHYLAALVLWLDDRRVRAHLRRTEQALRGRDAGSLARPLQAARLRHLDHLHRYWRGGLFPRHSARPDRWAPCFIDRAGRTCAVAELLVADGQSDLARRVADQANYAYLGQMDFPELDAWAAGSGLSKAELALIQPRYICPEVCTAAANEMIASWYEYLRVIVGSGAILALGSFLLGGLGLVRRRRSLTWIGGIFGLATGISLLFVNLRVAEAIFWPPLGFEFHCPGAGFADTCQPNFDPELIRQFHGQTSASYLLANLSILVSLVGLVKAAKGDQFSRLHLVLSVAGGMLLLCAICLGLPGLG